MMQVMQAEVQSFAIINNDVVNIFVHKTLLVFQNYIVRIDSFELELLAQRT